MPGTTCEPLAELPPQVLVVGGESSAEAAAEAVAGEARDGVTPPMRNARERVFRKPIDVDARTVSKVEEDLLCILAVSACFCVFGDDAGWGRQRRWPCRGAGRRNVPCTVFASGPCAPNPNSILQATTSASRPLQGGAPVGLKFVDTEEEWVVDPATGQGQWLPVRR